MSCVRPENGLQVFGFAARCRAGIAVGVTFALLVVGADGPEHVVGGKDLAAHPATAGVRGAGGAQLHRAGQRPQRIVIHQVIDIRVVQLGIDAGKDTQGCRRFRI